MSRIAPVEAKSTSWWMRLMFWKAKRMMGRVPAPLPVMAHNPGVAVANAALELALAPDGRIARVFSMVVPEKLSRIRFPEA